MDFNSFKQWCQDKGFIITLPSGCIQLMGLDGKCFEQFKGFFNLCMMFFEEENKRKSDWCDSASSPDGDVDLGKEIYQRELASFSNDDAELQNSKSGD